ncbi:MAG: hypothetical protein ABSG04_08110, partial [Verrucomicrobiota bacterium]
MPYPGRRRRPSGFTVAELMVASATLIMVFGAVIAINLWGLAMTQRSSIWNVTGDDARKSMAMLHQDVRTAYAIYVGNGSLAGFTNAGSTNIQAGNALKLFASTNTNSWTLYYYDPAVSTLYRTNWDGTSVGDFRTVSANPITNDNYIFTMQ